MKYIFLYIGYLLFIAYLILEKSIKIIVYTLIFLWHISFNKRYYPNFSRIWVIGMGGLYDIREVNSPKECYSFYLNWYNS